VSRVGYVLAGVVFAFCLSRARATHYDAIMGMFRLTDLHLFGVIGCAVATAALGLWLLRMSARRSISGAPMELEPKPFRRGLVSGGLAFGVGWALSGACPGTALAQLGEGKLYALATVSGIVLGTWLERGFGVRERELGVAAASAG
jgi:uncharacterized membrane protein YedE/YeeE